MLLGAMQVPQSGDGAMKERLGSVLQSRRLLFVSEGPFTKERTKLMKRLIAVAFASATLLACKSEPESPVKRFETAKAERRDLTVTASATGVVQPVRVVEVKSKASGEIVELAVESGDYVQQGALLARLYPRDAENQRAQARADVEAARARLMTAESEFKRAASLRNAQLIPESDYESKRLEVANARAQLVRAQTTMEIASERLRETVVSAPVTGRIIEKNVELGNVVSSAVSQVSGGTTLMKMADLREVEIRALVDETDIGRVSPGQRARIRVDAFPNQNFAGEIAKIEPQAVVEQSVTMFPVLIRIANEQELLKPGMNAEVDIFISRQENVLSVPNEAIKSMREAAMAARAVGLTPEDIQASLRGAGGEGGARGAGAGRETATAAASPAANRQGRPEGRTGGGGTGARGGGHWGGGDAAAGGQGRRSNMSVVFKLVDGKPTPTRVMTGVANWDHTQILSGLSEGDELVVLPSASMLRQQEQFRERMRGVSGVPGMTPSGGGGRRGGA